MTAREVFIIGAPAEGRQGNGIEGTRTLDCELCKGPTLFAPSSLERPEAQTARFICWPCSRNKLSPNTQIADITPEQIRELIKAGQIYLAPGGCHMRSHGLREIRCRSPGRDGWFRGNRGAASRGGRQPRARVLGCSQRRQPIGGAGANRGAVAATSNR